MRLVHPWPPLYDQASKVLILGTFPSPKSRQMGFPYGHPQNIFWRTLATLLGQPPPARQVATVKQFALDNGIALWDVLHACDIDGAADASIKKPEANLFAPILAETNITAIFTTGKTATNLFNKLCAAEAGMTATYLPSTSPANRVTQMKVSFLEQWRLVAKALQKGQMPVRL
ncbi:MAG: DNA-deoxyinosine glycosylase [Desulfobulbaceae bacterium]|jgi:hypoxanthine-DNA glycosylase|nr:DNA-deoxyinosine glycosylase [Desulfobulbaceae bacterium]